MVTSERIATYKAVVGIAKSRRKRSTVRRLSLLAMLLPMPAMAASAVPDCAWSLADGQSGPVQFRGKVLYVDFWASWCAPCVLSFPFMNALQREFGSRGLQVVAVDMDEHATDSQAFLAAHKTNFEIAKGPNVQCARALGVKAMPSSFLVDRKGIIRETVQGFRQSNEQHLRDSVSRLLAEDKTEPQVQQ